MLSAKKKNAAVIAKLKDNPQKLITTILVGNNIVNIALSAIATKLALAIFGSSGVAIVVGILTFMILVFGEITPKSLAMTYSEEIAQWTARPLQILSFILFPIVILFENISRFVLYLAGSESKAEVTEEELRVMISMGAKDKVIEIKEKEFIEGVLEFNDITAREVMTPRVKMFALDGETKIKDILPAINRKGFSRIPVYKETTDRIIGVVHIKDILDAVAKKKRLKKMKSLITEPVFVSEHRVLSDIFKEMQEKRTHLAIVIDEYGGTEGIITLEDLLEEIVGEIMDESDLSPKMILRIDKNTIVAHGNTEVDKVNEFFNVNLPLDEKYNTLNGLFHHKLRRTPRKNDKIMLDGVTLTAKEVSKRKVLKVKLKKSPV
jgi:CBS domain containing-hemolysin-like protein